MKTTKTNIEHGTMEVRIRGIIGGCTSETELSVADHATGSGGSTTFNDRDACTESIRTSTPTVTRVSTFSRGTQTDPVSNLRFVSLLYWIFLLHFKYVHLCAVVWQKWNNSPRFAGEHPFPPAVKIYKLIRRALGLVVNVWDLKVQELFQALNDSLKDEVAKREKRSWRFTLFVIPPLAWVLCAMVGLMILFGGHIAPLSMLSCFDDDVKYVKKPRICWNSGRLGLVIWYTEVIAYTDYWLKFGTVLLKLVILGLPAWALDFSKREKAYQLIEYTSQLCRLTLPMKPWIILMADSFTGRPFSSQLLSLPLIALYLYYKLLIELVKVVRKWWFAVKSTLPFTTQNDSNNEHCDGGTARWVIVL